MSCSQTIGNQTSSFRSQRPQPEPQAEGSLPTTRKMGILVSGLPSTRKVKKLEKYMANDKAPHKKIPKEYLGNSVDFHLHYHQWYNGHETTGEGIYTYDEGSANKTDLEKISKLMNGQRIDKKHTIRTSVVPICFDCHFPLDCEGTPYHLPKGNLEKASTLDRNVCDMCLPSPIHCCCCDSILTEQDDPNNMAKVMGQFACRSCWKDSDIQEKWRYNEENKLINATISSYVEELHLSDEAIEREKELMGGVPRPCKDITPFINAFYIKDLIYPTSRNYWPFGMNAQQYLEHIALMDFNNPLQETPDESWREIEVTEEILTNYYRDMNAAFIHYTYNYSEEGRGSLPEEIISGDCKYRLVGQGHGFTCDSPICQAVFQHCQKNDEGAFSALVATNIPIFTTRTGRLQGTAREMGFGQERCIVCISKVFH